VFITKAAEKGGCNVGAKSNHQERLKRGGQCSKKEKEEPKRMATKRKKRRRRGIEDMPQADRKRVWCYSNNTKRILSEFRLTKDKKKIFPKTAGKKQS